MRRQAVFDGSGITDLAIYDTQEMREVVAACQAAHDAGIGQSGDMYVLGEVPGIVIEAWCHERGVEFSEFMRSSALSTEFINSEHAKPFRIWRGKF